MKTCDSGAVMDVPVAQFEELVAAALDGIPPALGHLIENVAVFVEDGAVDGNLLGLYQGIPLTRRENYGLGGGMPDRITIYRLPILARCRTEDEVIAAVRITVVHEVGHHFGMTDARLRELGYG
jgi:predicted Zn-dependent protease with MMP-like domain